MLSEYGSAWGMHLFWWAFWIFLMVSVFGFNVPERARVNSLDPSAILKRRLAKGEINEEQFRAITAQLSGEVKSNDRSLTVVPTQRSIWRGHPIVDGLSLSVTWMIFYSACSGLYGLAPEAVTTATGKLFHGMSFTRMAAEGTPFGFGDFASVLTLGAVYAFSAGCVWSLVHSYFYRKSIERHLSSIDSQSIPKSRLSA